MNNKLKNYETIGCCGIDCGLCPRYHTKAASACPGCGGLNFREKHPSCGYVTCCALKKHLEICSHCNEYPCKRFDAEKKGFDSFVSHKKIFENLNYVKNHSLDEFLNQQIIRINILSYFIARFDDGRSKSFFCLACTLLPLRALQENYQWIIEQENYHLAGELNLMLKDRLKKIASDLKIEFKLNNKKSEG